MENQVLEYEIKDKIVIVRISETRLYQNINPHFREELLKIHHNHADFPLILNMQNVEVINSSGIGVLIMFADLIKKEGNQFVIVGLKPLLQELFERMRLETIFTIRASEEEGCKELVSKDKKPCNQTSSIKNRA